MRKNIIALSLALAFLLPGSSAEALSCVPLDMYLESVIKDGEAHIYIGTATAVKNHTQVVTVTKPLQGWVAPKIWVEHNYSNDWQYFCSNGPSKAGKSTIFFSTINKYGTFTVQQTLDVDSTEGKAFLETIEKADIDAGITEAKPADRADEVRQSIDRLVKALLQMFEEWKYWHSESKK